MGLLRLALIGNCFWGKGVIQNVSGRLMLARDEAISMPHANASQKRRLVDVRLGITQLPDI
jgi:hypothetical protein